MNVFKSSDIRFPPTLVNREKLKKQLGINLDTDTKYLINPRIANKDLDLHEYGTTQVKQNLQLAHDSDEEHEKKALLASYKAKNKKLQE